MAVKEFEPNKFVFALAVPAALIFTLAMLLLGRVNAVASLGLFALTYLSFTLITLLAGTVRMKVKGTNVFVLALLTLVMSSFLTVLFGTIPFTQFTAGLLTLEFWVSGVLLVASVALTLFFLPELTRMMRKR